MAEKKYETVDDLHTIDGFVLENSEKLERVVYGSVGRAGVPVGGMGLENALANPQEVLARYDRIAGYITKDGVKIKMGSFWDFSREVNAPRKTPQVRYIFNIGGERVEVDDPKNLASAIATVEEAKAKKEGEVKRKKATSKFKDK